MAEDDLRKEIRGLRAQVEALREALAAVSRPYKEVASDLEQFRGVFQRYVRILDLYQRHGGLSPDLVIPGLKDDISRHIVTVLVAKGDRNISQITEAVKARRGTASRRIVRERLADLERDGIIVSSPHRRGRTFRVADEVITKWSEVLGLPKYRDQTTMEPQGGNDG